MKEKSQVSEAIRELTEAVLGAKERNTELQNALLAAREQLVKMHEQNEILRGRFEAQDTASLEERREFGEKLDISQANLMLEVEKRESCEHKLSSAATQIQLLQTQLQESQQKHWAALGAEKEVSAFLSEEVNVLRSNTEVLAQKLEASEKELTDLRTSTQKEIAFVSNMSNSLRDELEKRLNELLVMRKDRDTLRAEKESFVQVASEREKTIKRNELGFQKTLESDRSRLQQEAKAFVSRIKALETDKEELLREIEELGDKLMEAQRVLSKLKDDHSGVQKENATIFSQLSDLKGRYADAIKELKEAARKEEDVREDTARLQRKYREEEARLESVAKEAKRASAAQVSQLSLNLKAMQEEAGALKKYNAELGESERYCIKEVEKLRQELSIKSEMSENMEGRFANESAAVKRELKEANNKCNQLSEAKSKLEMEVVEKRLAITKSESEVERWKNAAAEMESRLHSMGAEINAGREKIAKVTQSYNDLKLRFVETEESCHSKEKHIETLSLDISKLEREGFAEARGLRVSTKAMSIEISDLKAQTEMYRKEIEDTKAALSKLQSSSCASINALLEELTCAEDVFASYRKSSQEELNDSHTKLTEIKLLFERAKESLEEYQIKARGEKSVY